MRRIARVAAVTLMMLGLLASSLVAAPSRGANAYPYKTELMEGLRLVDDGKYVKARDLAERFLEQEPESFQSWFLMGIVMEYAEGNLPRAWYYLSGARQRIEKLYGGPEIPADGPWWAHLRVLLTLAEVGGQMEKFEEELDLLATYDRLYKPSHAAWYAWPLMKLGRYEEARARIKQALRERPNDEASVTVAYNSLGAVEGEQGNIEKAYEIFRGLIERVRTRGWSLEATYFHNAAEQAMQLLKFSEQEQLLIEGTKHFDAHSYTNPYISLSMLYVSSGRIGEALDSVKRMHEWSHASEPRVEQQHWNEQQEVTASALLAAGYDGDALALMRRTLNRPDRRGTNSMHQDQTEIASLLLYRDLLQMEGERYAEHAAWSTWTEWVRLQAARLDNQRQLWTVACRVASVIIDNHRIEWSTRPYAIDSRVPEFVRPSLHAVLGAGVVSVEGRRLLERDTPVGEREKPYLLALTGEAEAARGDLASAVTRLRAALQGLPVSEALLRARATAILARCLERQGDLDAAIGEYRKTLEKAPNVLREVGCALPVSIESDGGPSAASAARWLGHSPRFNPIGGGFIMRVGSAGGRVEATLLGADQTVLARASVPETADASETARALCQEVHNRVFSPRIDLSQTTINSLDGSNQSVDANRDRLLKVFGLPGASGSPAPHP